MTNRIILLACSIAIFTLSSCKKTPDKPAESIASTSTETPRQDGRLHSHFGSSIACPADWKSTDSGDTWTLKSPDHQATVSIWTLPAKGEETLQDFQKTMTDSINKEGAWKSSEWMPMQIGGTAGVKRTFDPQEGNSQLPCRAYLLRTGNYYTAILLRASDDAMASNGDAYENIVQSFHGP